MEEPCVYADARRCHPHKCGCLKLKLTPPQHNDVRMSALVSNSKKRDELEKITILRDEAEWVCGNPDNFDAMDVDAKRARFCLSRNNASVFGEIEKGSFSVLVAKTD